MKKLCLFFLIFHISLLCGCGLLPQRREVETLRIIQTVGVDYAPGGVRLTLASAAGPSGEQAGQGLSGTGRNLSAALEQIRAASPEQELFTGHVRSILVGQEAAEHGLDDLLSLICRSSDLRLDTPLYIVRGGSAEDLINSASEGDRGITEILLSLRAREERQPSARSSTASEIQRALLRSDSALVTALTTGEAAEGSGKTALPAGLAVLEGGKLSAWIEPADALGAELLCGTAGRQELNVLDLGGLPVSLELQRGESSVSPVWNEDGSLRGLDVTARVRAAVLETAANSAAGLARYDDHLTGQLEAAVSERIGRILQLARQEKLDLTGLGRRVEQSDPQRWQAQGQNMAELLPGLEISIAVRGELLHTYDAKETEP